MNDVIIVGMPTISWYIHVFYIVIIKSLENDNTGKHQLERKPGADEGRGRISKGLRVYLLANLQSLEIVTTGFGGLQAPLYGITYKKLR